MTEKKLAYIFFRENNIVVENDRAVISCHLQNHHICFFFTLLSLCFIHLSHLFSFLTEIILFKRTTKGKKKKKNAKTHISIIEIEGKTF